MQKINSKTWFNLIQRFSSTSTSERIKIVWNSPSNAASNKRKIKKNIYADLPYDQQLKLKQECATSFIKNVLITIYYDTKIDFEFKQKQISEGEKAIENVTGVVPFSTTDIKHLQTSQVMEIWEDFEIKKQFVKDVRFNPYRTYQNEADNEICEEGEEGELVDHKVRNQEELIKFNYNNRFESFTPKFKPIAQHIDQLISLEECKYPSKTYKSYYSDNWNWHYFDVRRNRKDDFMLIAGFHPQNLPSDDVNRVKNKIKEYFVDGPGKECNFSSIYFQVLNNKSQVTSNKDIFERLHGAEKLMETCDGKEFSFYPQNFYPIVYESYENLNKVLASMIKSSSANETVVEIDGANGVLATLCKDYCKRFYITQNSTATIGNVEANLKSHGLNEDFKVLYKSNNKILGNLIWGDDQDESRITLVFQNYGHKLNYFERVKRKNFLTSMRKTKKIKTILYVNCSHVGFKIEEDCYELMSGERENKNIVGKPFTCTEMALVDFKPETNRCYVITKLERE